MFRVVTWVMLVLLVYAAAVQYNDPDGLLWVVIYGVPIVLTAMTLRNRHSRLSMVSAPFYFAGFLYLMPKTPGPWLEIEEAREALGLLICGVWLAALMAKGVRQSGKGDAEAPAE